MLAPLLDDAPTSDAPEPFRGRPVQASPVFSVRPIDLVGAWRRAQLSSCLMGSPPVLGSHATTTRTCAAALFQPSAFPAVLPCPRSVHDHPPQMSRVTCAVAVDGLKKAHQRLTAAARRTVEVGEEERWSGHRG